MSRKIECKSRNSSVARRVEFITPKPFSFSAPILPQHGTKASKRSNDWSALNHKMIVNPKRCSKPVIWSADQVALLNQSI